jgi:hypothetical protein
MKFNGNPKFDDEIWRATGSASELLVHFTHICAKEKKPPQRSTMKTNKT